MCRIALQLMETHLAARFQERPIVIDGSTPLARRSVLAQYFLTGQSRLLLLGLRNAPALPLSPYEGLGPVFAVADVVVLLDGVFDIHSVDEQFTQEIIRQRSWRLSQPMEYLVPPESPLLNMKLSTSTLRVYRYVQTRSSIWDFCVWFFALNVFPAIQQQLNLPTIP